MTRAMVYAFRLELGNATAANPMVVPVVALMLIAAWGRPRRGPLRSPA
jgi:hypothetical protein